MRWLGIISCITIQAAAGQWDVPAPIQFDGLMDQERQVLGLSAPVDAADAISAGLARNQGTTYAHAIGTDQLIITLTPPATAYTPGMQLSFVPENANNGPATLDVNGLGPIALVKFNGAVLDSADLRPGIPATVVHDGIAFQLISQSHPACPVGYMALSRDVCIQFTVNDSIGFLPANVRCVDRNARMCSFAEWYRGCSMPGGFGPTLAAFEWVDSAANDPGQAKRVGSNSGGTFGCDQGGSTAPSSLHVYRCCYDR